MSINNEKRNVLKILKKNLQTKNCKVFGTKSLKKYNSLAYNCKGCMVYVMRFKKPWLRVKLIFFRF